MRIINQDMEFSVLQLVHNSSQSIHAHLILNQVVTHYGCGARKPSDNEATVTGLNPWKGQITLNYSLQH